HVFGVDISIVGHEQAVARARDAEVSHLVQFRLGDIHAIALPPASFDVIMSLDVWWRFPSLETPQSYLEAVQAAGLRLLYHVDTSTYGVRFYTRLLAVYLERRAEFEVVRGPERYQEGLKRLQLSQHLATTGVLGQFACIAEKPTGV